MEALRSAPPVRIFSVLASLSVVVSVLFHGQVIGWVLIGLAFVLIALGTLFWLSSRRSE